MKASHSYEPLLRYAWLAVLATSVVGCADNPLTQNDPPVGDDGSAYWPDTEWRRASPSAVSLDGQRIAGLVERLRDNRIPNLHSLQIVRFGYLAVDEYFNGSSADAAHTLQSVSKSITSLLVGIAKDQGLIASLDQPWVSFFPEYPNLQNLDSRKSAMTLRDILTMRTGLDWSEDSYQGSPLETLNSYGGDWLRFVLDWPMRDQPGTRWEYNSGGVISLGGVIHNTAGLAADEFARQHLFRPLGITTDWWHYGHPNGLPHMGGGLNLRATDMARIGYLVLRGGQWSGQQIISRQWLDESLTPIVQHPRTFGPHPVDYGYLWWLLPLNGSGPTGDPNNTIYTAAGAQAQWIFIVPRHDLVVAVTGNSQNFALPVDFLYDDILPAVR